MKYQEYIGRFQLDNTKKLLSVIYFHCDEIFPKFFIIIILGFIHSDLWKQQKNTYEFEFE